MTYRGGVFTGAVGTAAVAAAAGVVWYLLAAPPKAVEKTGPPPVPATVAKTAKEDQFNTVVLTPDAEARLGLATGTTERKPVRRSRTFGGDIVVPPGQSIIVSAPLGGVLKAVAGVPAAGGAVAKDQPIFTLLPLLDPVGRANLTVALVDADGRVESAKTVVENAKIDLARAETLLKVETGLKQAQEAAIGALHVAEKALEGAVASRKQLAAVVGDLDKGTTTPLAIKSPMAGVLRTVSARPDVIVPAAQPLFEVVDVSTVWVRVPVYAADAADMVATAPAAVGGLAGKPGGKTLPANPAPAPPAANPLTGTVDLIYQLDNRGPGYRPGERVGVTLALAGEAESLTAPWAAVLHDYTGGTWVYEALPNHTYARRRVILAFVVGDTAVLAAGPAPGTKVVTAGAAELFGTETGFSK